VPRALERLTGLLRFAAAFVLEGAGVDDNGAGTLLTTESGLLNTNREPRRTHEQMERRLADWLGSRHVIWLSAGIAGDDTDGHIDDIARCVAPSTVVAVVGDDATADDHAILRENLRWLRRARDAAGRRLDVVSLPLPPPLVLDGQRCPASYANFYFANDCVLVPTFATESDARAGDSRGVTPGADTRRHPFARPGIPSRGDPLPVPARVRLALTGHHVIGCSSWQGRC
jgi:agmatine deiminase